MKYLIVVEISHLNLSIILPVAINDIESSVICSFKQKYRLAVGLRDLYKYQLVTGDFNKVKTGDNATSYVAINKPRYSIKMIQKI